MFSMYKSSENKKVQNIIILRAGLFLAGVEEKVPFNNLKDKVK